MNEYLVLRLEGPLQSWGGVALDPRRPTRDFPSLSGVTGLLASALGWRYRDGNRTTALQDAIEMSVREDRPPDRMHDYQTVDLGAMPSKGWTRWGVEERGGAFSSGTHILHKEYLANAAFTVALRLTDETPATIRELQEALLRPARPLFLGRKSCPPSAPIFETTTEAASPIDVLIGHPPAPGSAGEEEGAGLRFWFPAEVSLSAPGDRQIDVWDRRDFLHDRFEGSRRVIEIRLPVRQKRAS